jgi:hypothetical protein
MRSHSYLSIGRSHVLAAGSCQPVLLAPTHGGRSCFRRRRHRQTPRRKGEGHQVSGSCPRRALNVPSSGRFPKTVTSKVMPVPGAQFQFSETLKGVVPCKSPCGEQTGRLARGVDRNRQWGGSRGGPGLPSGRGKQIDALSEDGEGCLRLFYLRYVVLHCSPFRPVSIRRRGERYIWRATNRR